MKFSEIVCLLAKSNYYLRDIQHLRIAPSTHSTQPTVQNKLTCNFLRQLFSNPKASTVCLSVHEVNCKNTGVMTKYLPLTIDLFPQTSFS